MIVMLMMNMMMPMNDDHEYEDGDHDISNRVSWDVGRMAQVFVMSSSDIIYLFFYLSLPCDFVSLFSIF